MKTAKAWPLSKKWGLGGIIWAANIRKPISKPLFGGQTFFDFKPFETWDEEGARDTQTLASTRVKKMLGDYQAPTLDEGLREALNDYVARKKAAEPDAFI